MILKTENFYYRKGISNTVIPFRRSSPRWSIVTLEKLTPLICQLAKKGLVPSQIGIYLRDCKGIPQIKSITGKKIIRILKAKKMAPEIPEDLYFLIKKAVNVRKHLERNKKDKDSKFRLILIESKIHRLSRYYKRKNKLPNSWAYGNSSIPILNN